VARFRYGGRRRKERKNKSCGKNWSHRRNKEGEKKQGKVDKKHIKGY